MGIFRFFTVIVDWIGKVEAFCQVCKCHPTILKDALPKDFSCPISGFRIIDFASGDLEPFLEEVTAWSHTQVHLRIQCAPLTEHEKAGIMLEVGLAKSAVWTEGSLRQRENVALPSRTLAIANNNAPKALQAGAECIIMFNTLSEADQAAAHPKTKELCQPGHEMFDDLMLALEQGGFQPEGPLADFRYRCQFGVSNETPIEARHAYSHKHISKAPRHSEAFIAVHNRKLQVDHHIETVEGHREFVTNLQRIANASDAIKELGMENHPRCKDRLCPNVPYGLASKVIYHNDEMLQFQDLGDLFGNGGQPDNGDDRDEGDDADDDDQDGPDDGLDKGGHDGKDAEGKGKDKREGDDKHSDAESGNSRPDDGGFGGGGGGRSLSRKVLRQHLYPQWKSVAQRGAVFSCKFPHHQAFFPPTQTLKTILQAQICPTLLLP